MKQFLYIILFGVVIAGCSDSQVTVEEESKKTVKSAKPAGDGPSNTIEPGIDDVNADTIGMAEFLALKASVAAKYRQANGLTDEENEDTTGFAAFKRSKAKTAAKPCDCDDSTMAKNKRDNNSRNSRTTKDNSDQETDSTDEVDSSDHAQIVEGSSPVSRKPKSKMKEKSLE